MDDPDRSTPADHGGGGVSTDEDEVLIAKLTTALGRVDSGSAGGYNFRRYVARTDLLPLVKTLIAEAAEEIAEEIAEAIDRRKGTPAGPEYFSGLCDAARVARRVGAAA